MGLAEKARVKGNLFKFTYGGIELDAWLQFDNMSVYGNDFKGVKVEGFSIQHKDVPVQKFRNHGGLNLRETLRQRKRR